MKTIARAIRSIIPRPLRKMLHKVGDLFGRGLDHSPQLPGIEGALQTLHRMGFRPTFCIDVGAYHGEWAKMFKTIFPMAKILMIEAQEAKRPILQQLIESHGQDMSMEIALLGPTDHQIVQFTEMETGSSVYEEASPYPRVTTEKSTQRLDTLLTGRKYPSAEVLKLDVQGYELEVLRGAPDALRKATLVLMEASLVPINANCPLIAEVMAFMNTSGFQLFDFCSQIRRKDGVLWQTDLLFLRTDSPFLPKTNLTHENWA